jgi:hypothetical protein
MALNNESIYYSFEGVPSNSRTVELRLQKQLLLATLLQENGDQSGDMNDYLSFITSAHIAIFLKSNGYRIFSNSTQNGA